MLFLAAGTGLDFSAASVVVFVELPHEVALVQQAEDRAHRHGQTLPVNIYFLLARGSTDERRHDLFLCFCSHSVLMDNEPMCNTLLTCS